MALGDPYVTASELKTYLGISGATDDTAIGDAVSAVSRAIEKFCQRQFNKTTTASARVFYPSTCLRAEVDDFHTTTDLAIKTDAGDDGTFENTWATTDYQLEPLNGIVDGESGWPYSQIRVRSTGAYLFTRAGAGASLQVTAQWGWNAVPAAVKQACYLAAEEMFKAREAPFGIAGMGEFGPVRVRDNPKVASLLAPYRRYPVLVA